MLARTMMNIYDKDAPLSLQASMIVALGDAIDVIQQLQGYICGYSKEDNGDVAVSIVKDSQPYKHAERTLDRLRKLRDTISTASEEF